MRDFEKGLGAVQVHNKALADIVAQVVDGVEGVSLAEPSFIEKMSGLFSDKSFPGVDVLIDEAQEVSLDVKVVVRYGLNVSAVAHQLQEAISDAIEKTADIHLREVNVSIHGIERGQA